MTSASGASLRLSTTEFVLASDTESHNVFFHGAYNHNYSSVNADAIAIAGGTGQQNLDPEVMYWDMTNWINGEADGVVGSKVFDANDISDANTYDTALANTRQAGQITSPPLRTDGTIVGSLTTPLKTVGYLQNASGLVFFASNDGSDISSTAPRNLLSSSNGTTWTTRNLSGGEVADATHGKHYYITSLTADVKYCYVALEDRQDSRRVIYRIADTGDGSQFSDRDDDSLEFVGMAVLRQFLFGWTGSRLFSFDTTDSSGVAGSTLVYDTGAFDAADPFPSAFSASAITGDSAVYMFFSDGVGNTTIHQFKDTSGTPYITLPQGFSGRCMTFSNSVLYIAGVEGNQAAFYFIPVADGILRFGGFIREGSDLTPVSIASGPGAQVLILMDDGSSFIFDASVDSLSTLDEVDGYAHAYAIDTYKGIRLAAFDDNANSRYRFATWAMDSTGGAANGTFTVTSSEWDFNLPFEPNKIFEGVHVRSSELSDTQTIEVRYARDQSGTGGFVSAGTLTSGTSNYIKITDSKPATGGTGTNGTKSFGSLRIKVIGTGSSGAACPTLYAVVPRAENWNFIETWRLVFKCQDEVQGNRISGRDAQGWQIRDTLLTLMENRTVVTFVDVQRYSADMGARQKTYEVRIEDVTDDPLTPGNGLCRLTLRNIAPNGGAEEDA